MRPLADRCEVYDRMRVIDDGRVRFDGGIEKSSRGIASWSTLPPTSPLWREGSSARPTPRRESMVRERLSGAAEMVRHSASSCPNPAPGNGDRSAWPAGRVVLDVNSCSARWSRTTGHRGVRRASSSPVH